MPYRLFVWHSASHVVPMKQLLRQKILLNRSNFAAEVFQMVQLCFFVGSPLHYPLALSFSNEAPLLRVTCYSNTCLFCFHHSQPPWTLSTEETWQKQQSSLRMVFIALMEEKASLLIWYSDMRYSFTVTGIIHPSFNCILLYLVLYWVFQQDNNPEHTSKSTQERFKKKSWCLMWGWRL